MTKAQHSAMMQNIKINENKFLKEIEQIAKGRESEYQLKEKEWQEINKLVSDLYEQDMKAMQNANKDISIAESYYDELWNKVSKDQNPYEDQTVKAQKQKIEAMGTEKLKGHNLLWDEITKLNVQSKLIGEEMKTMITETNKIMTNKDQEFRGLMLNSAIKVTNYGAGVDKITNYLNSKEEIDLQTIVKFLDENGLSKELKGDVEIFSHTAQTKNYKAFADDGSITQGFMNEVETSGDKLKEILASTPVSDNIAANVELGGVDGNEQV